MLRRAKASFALLPALLAAASSAPVVLTDDVLSIPRGEWRWVRFAVRQPVLVDCSFEEISGGAGVRVELLSKSDLLRFSAGQRHQAVAATPEEKHGELEQVVSAPGEYAVVLSSGRKARRAESVRLTVRLNFTPGARVRYLPRERRIAVVLLSLTGFFAILALSARKLFHELKHFSRVGAASAKSTTDLTDI